MKFEKWNISVYAPEAETVLCKAGVPPLAAAVLCSRGIRTIEEAKVCLDHGPHLLHDPFALRDMERAVERIYRAISAGERIAVYGDYDVDGITATCLMVCCLQEQGANCMYYIPDRLEEGYGLNQEAISHLAAEGITLLITVDCGITAVEEVEYAKALGVDVVVTDHHACKDVLPNAQAVVNPHRADCTYPFPYLAGVGVALKLALALAKAGDRPQVLRAYAPLAAVGTIADVMPLTGENRAILQMGLEEIRREMALFQQEGKVEKPGFCMLIREAGLEKRGIDSTGIGFVLAPRINAAGRMGCARVAAELLLTERRTKAEALAKRLCQLNRERQSIEQQIFNQAVSRVQALGPDERSALVLEDATWHQGVVGIVASRLAEQYACPVFMICLDGEKGKGSCRSYNGFNLFEALEENADLLEGFGGHALAAGFTIRREQIPAFRARLNACVQRCWGAQKPISALSVDVELHGPELLTLEQIRALSILEPYGAGNPQPVFCMCGLTIAVLSHVGDGRHLKLRLKKGERQFDAIFFSATAQECAVRLGDRVDAAFTLQINEFRGNQTIQLVLVDLRHSHTRAQIQQALYEKYQQGIPLTGAEVEMITPNREEFAAVWRYLEKRAGMSGLEDTLPNLSRKIAKVYGLHAMTMRTMVCLEVFAERGLLSLEKDREELRIVIRKNVQKVDLEQSPIMAALRQGRWESGRSDRR